MKTKQNNYLQDTLKLHCTYKVILCIISSMMMPYINYNFITLKLQSFFQNASVAQWIEWYSPKVHMQVRFLPGAISFFIPLAYRVTVLFGK